MFSCTTGGLCVLMYDMDIVCSSIQHGICVFSCMTWVLCVLMYNMGVLSDMGVAWEIIIFLICCDKNDLAKEGFVLAPSPSWW